MLDNKNHVQKVTTTRTSTPDRSGPVKAPLNESISVYLYEGNSSGCGYAPGDLLASLRRGAWQEGAASATLMDLLVLEGMRNDKKISVLVKGLSRYRNNKFIFWRRSDASNPRFFRHLLCYDYHSTDRPGFNLNEELAFLSNL